MPQRNAGLRTFSWPEIHDIRARYMMGESQGALARSYRVSLNTIGRIVRGETYIEGSRTGIEHERAEGTAATNPIEESIGLATRARAGQTAPYGFEVNGADIMIWPGMSDDQWNTVVAAIRARKPAPSDGQRGVDAANRLLAKYGLPQQSAPKIDSDNQLGDSGEID